MCVHILQINNTSLISHKFLVYAKHLFLGIA